ncbi:MAG: thiamine phosphate synthase [Rickettsiaceae bacterium H1]|nr:thiamine phosphate synthase [Rickettsiaceae bacterium H1]
MPNLKNIWILIDKKQHEQFSHLPKAIFIAENKISYEQIIPKLNPKKSMVIIRMYDTENREIIAKKIAKLCKIREIKFLVAKDPKLALKIKADGIHLSEKNFFSLKTWKKKMPKWIITASAHNMQKLRKIKNYDLTAAIYSPIFPTTTHPERKHVGTFKFRKEINNLNFPVYALGGINKSNIRKLKSINIAGIAGISLFNEF